VDAMGAANVGDSGFGKTEKSYFALLDEITDRPATPSMGTAGSMRCW
jgi:hypothetical protein